MKNEIYPGKRVGRWSITDEYVKVSRGEKKWKCRCDCGTERYVLERSLKHDGSFSCGCIRKENAYKAVAHDLPGQIFGELTVLHIAEKQQKNGGIWWNCSCSCGNQCDVPATLLMQGKKTHCGCKTQKDYHFVDISGQRFERLVALYPLQERTKRGGMIWHCRCDCGNIAYAQTGHLNAGTRKSCGCIQQQKQKDLSGQRFGKLVVLRATDKRKSRSILWECKCDCGNVCLKPTGELNWGTATSCGCAWRQSTVKAGIRYGRLIALEPTERRDGKSVVWKCQCDCGKVVEARATSLQSGHVESCGCIKIEADKVKMLKNLTYQDDTCIEFLEKISVPTKKNTTGVRGVTLKKDGTYQAGLTFRKKRYYLGRFKTLEEAAKARKQAEIMVEEYLEQYREEQLSERKIPNER